MNENEIFRLKGRIAISNLSREDKDMIRQLIKITIKQNKRWTILLLKKEPM